jgi:queuosine precursor transporter
VVLQDVFANLFVVKQISLFGFSVTCSDVFAIGGILGLNLFQEQYGRQEANQVVKASFLGLVFFMLMSKIHLFYHPLPSDQTHDAFAIVLSQTSRITLASIGVYWIVQKLDVQLFAFLKTIFTSLPIRVGISLILTQFLDTVLFSFLGLYGIVESMFDVIFLSFLIKCIIIFCCMLFTKLMRKNVPV